MALCWRKGYLTVNFSCQISMETLGFFLAFRMHRLTVCKRKKKKKDWINKSRPRAQQRRTSLFTAQNQSLMMFYTQSALSSAVSTSAQKLKYLNLSRVGRIQKRLAVCLPPLPFFRGLAKEAAATLVDWKWRCFEIWKLVILKRKGKLFEECQPQEEQGWVSNRLEWHGKWGESSFICVFFFFFVNAVSIQFWTETAGVLKRQGYRRSLSAPSILAFSAHFRGLMWPARWLFHISSGLQIGSFNPPKKKRGVWLLLCFSFLLIHWTV